MIRIHKSNEPRELAEHRNTHGADYSGGMPELRESLLKEQGYICAYCMSRISINKSKIEHIKCREKYKRLELNYQNMVICCEGNFDEKNVEEYANVYTEKLDENKKKGHCDTSKKNEDISIDLFSERIDKEIKYHSYDGIIKSDDDNWNNNINKTLRLNIDVLKNNRKQVLDGVIELLKRNNYSVSSLNSLLKKYTNKDEDGKYKPYCGIVIWYIKKKLK